MQDRVWLRAGFAGGVELRLVGAGLHQRAGMVDLCGSARADQQGELGSTSAAILLQIEREPGRPERVSPWQQLAAVFQKNIIRPSTILGDRRLRHGL